jgi:CubicO group peptidase (beta-lactamase class C family)
MAHTSGLPKILSVRLVGLIVLGDPDGTWEKVQTLPLAFEPNTQFSYNQTNYVVIGKIINKYMKNGFPEFITEKQFNPVGMELTAAAGFDYLEFIVPNQARQYIYAGDNQYRNFYREFPYILRTAAGVNSNATELAKFLIALQLGKLVKNLDLLLTPVTLSNGKTSRFNNVENNYAMGWQVIDRTKNSAVSSSGGNAVTIINYPQDQLSAVVLTNLLSGLPIQFVDEIAARWSLISFKTSKMKQTYFWPRYGEKDEVVFTWSKNRGIANPLEQLKGFTGKLSIDGYTAYISVVKKLYKHDHIITLTACWADLRRMFEKSQDFAPIEPVHAMNPKISQAV